VLVLELNDTGLRLADGEHVHAEAPGFASLDGSTVLVGEAARRRARLQPRLSHARYWYQLDQLPLDRPLGQARATADLAYWQLCEMRAAAGGEPLLLAVPSSFEPDQLGLLLGLCQAAELGAVGLVDSAVAAAASGAPRGTLLHVDLQLHRVWLTRLEVGDEVRRGSGHDLTKPGLMAVWDAAAQVIAEAFVRQTRFDPQHSAATEQVLYDALPGWLQRLSTEAVTSLSLDVAGRSHRISLSREALVAALQPVYGRVVSGLRAALALTPEAAVVLSDRIASLPGLTALLEASLGQAPLLFTPLATAQGALAYAALIEGDPQALPWVTRLPASGVDAAPRPTAERAPPATHWLEAHEAHRLDATTVRGVTLQSDAAGWILRADAGLTLNGHPVATDTLLRAGDELVTPHGRWRLIHVHDTATP